MASAGTNGADVRIEAGAVVLRGHLELPREQSPVVVVVEPAPASEYDRVSLQAFAEVGLGTLRLDLLHPERRVDGGEEPPPRDLAALASRWIGVIDWLTQDDRTADRPLGIFGAGVFSAPALVAAGERADRVAAVVTCGGRPHEAGDALDGVTAPTLLLSAEADDASRDSCLEALERLTTLSRHEVAPFADGALTDTIPREVLELARDWFTPHLVATRSPAEPPSYTATEVERRKG